MKTTTSVSFPLVSTRADKAENWLSDNTNTAGHIFMYLRTNVHFLLIGGKNWITRPGVNKVKPNASIKYSYY